MSFSPTYLSYKSTKSFSALVLDYLAQKEALAQFYQFAPTADGLKEAIEDRKNYKVPRNILQSVIKNDYEGRVLSNKLKENIASLKSENCFTICTAHQPNIFTGHLYFIYKILHAIKLSEELNAQYPDKKFVPVYYMGSEDADIEELGELNIEGTKYDWKPAQQGAVGRMTVDENLQKIISAVKAQIGVGAFADEILEKVEACYKKGETIEKATFKFVHELFGALGLVILLPDNPKFKEVFLDITKKEIETSFSHKAVAETIAAFPEEYKVQAGGREVNLFYLTDDQRIRVEKNEAGFSLENISAHLSADELYDLFNIEPKTISPNVILRPVFQEMILPNIAFIGGGGELAYWLELKKVFAEASVFFPVLVLRNSFTIIPDKSQQLILKNALSDEDIFLSELDIINKLVLKNDDRQLDLSAEIKSLQTVYEKANLVAAKVDVTLAKHTAALQQQALNKLQKLEKKMLSAARKQAEAQGRQVEKLKSQLFPGGNLQERVDNIIPWYAKYGSNLIKDIYEASAGINGEFCLLKENINGKNFGN